MSSALSRIFVILNKTDLSNDEKIDQIQAIKAEVEALPLLGIIARLVATPKSEGGFDWVNPSITDANFPTTAEPSLEGARLDKIVGSNDYVLAELKRLGRRAATTAEGLLYGVKNPEEQCKYWIWCLGQVWVRPGDRREGALMLGVGGDGRYAFLGDVASGVGASERVLSFPL